MTTYVLVHGGMHGSWCWEPVLEPLRAAGHRVDAVDLPGRQGGPVVAALDIASYVDVVTAAIDRAGEPVVLAVHSLGGVAAMLAAKSRWQAISRMVFVNSLLLRAGEGALDAFEQWGSECVLRREGALVFSTDGATVFVDSPRTAAHAFYNRCDAAVAEQAAAQLCPEPLTPLLERVAVSAARFGSVPKTYIGSRNDHVLPWTVQQRMSNTYSARFVELGGDHSPFLSATDDLLTVLDES
jgi:pimeloyl-ACP methyl ester carboxylesterase